MKAAAVLAVIVALFGGASLALQGPLPGDAALTIGLQGLLGPRPAWAGRQRISLRGKAHTSP